MTQLLAQLLAGRLAALPFADPAAGARVAGLARLATTTTNDGDTPRTLKLPLPAAWGPDECTRDGRYLTPDEHTPSIWFFEDYGTSDERLSGSVFGHVSSLRLLGWLNGSRLSRPLAEAELVAAVLRALRVRERHDAGPYRGLLLTATVLPAETSLFSRYTFATETPLLLPPYRLLGLEIKASYVLAPACPVADLPTITPVAPCPSF